MPTAGSSQPQASTTPAQQISQPIATASPSHSTAPIRKTARVGLAWPTQLLEVLRSANKELYRNENLRLDLTQLTRGRQVDAESYDVVGVTNPIQDAQSGKLIPIPKSIVISNYSPALIKPYKYHDKLFALPLAFSVKSFVYRKDLLAGEGLAFPQTSYNWQQLADAAERLNHTIGNSRVERTGLMLSTSAHAYDWLIFGWQNGGNVWPEDTPKPKFDSSEFIEAAQYFRSFFRNTIGLKADYQSRPSPTSSVFGAELAAMAFRDFHELKALRELPDDILARVDLALPPIKVTSALSGGGRMMLGIPANSRQLDVGATAIERLAHPAMADVITKNAGLAPADMSLQLRLEKTDPRYRTYFRSIEFMRDWRAWPVSEVIWDARLATPRLALSSDSVKTILEQVTHNARHRASSALKHTTKRSSSSNNP
jgi:ABC-type glycerol-3-phosphate transport system substrate-binding protein